MLSCRRFDGGSGEVVSGSGRNFFVLLEPFHRPFQLTGGGLKLKTVDDLVNRNAGEAENAVLFSVASRACLMTFGWCPLRYSERISVSRMDLTIVYDAGTVFDGRRLSS